MSELLPIFGKRDGKRRQIIGHTRVDADLLACLSQWKWNRTKAGYVFRYETVVPGRNGQKKAIYLHRLLTGARGKEQVDHINRDPSDNRLANLRLVTDAENKENVPARGGSSEFRGVSWDASRGKWQAKVRKNGRTFHAGRFDSEDEAAVAAERLRSDLMPFASGKY